MNNIAYVILGRIFYVKSHHVFKKMNRLKFHSLYHFINCNFSRKKLTYSNYTPTKRYSSKVNVRSRQRAVHFAKPKQTSLHSIVAYLRNILRLAIAEVDARDDKAKPHLFVIYTTQARASKLTSLKRENKTNSEL